jgi:hypothetical protein
MTIIMSGGVIPEFFCRGSREGLEWILLILSDQFKKTTTEKNGK